MAVRRGRPELRQDDAPPRHRAGRGRGRHRPGRLPHVHRPPRGCARRARRPGGLRHVARGRRRAVLVERIRAGDLRARGHGHPREPGHDGGHGAAGAAAGVVGARERAGRRAASSGVGGGAWRLPRRGEDGGGMRLLVCGGAGFIGSNFARLRVRDFGDEVVVLDKLTYAGRRENLEDTAVPLIEAGIEDRGAVQDAVAGCDAVVNFAAETHVDRSIAEPDAFVKTHSEGTYVLLEAVRERGIRYVQVSTDEVYGSIEEGSFTESSPLAPSSPYSATKAGADLLVAGYVHTYGLEACICRGSNNYGPRQYPEKLIPLMILNALHGDPLPVYGDGQQVRNWIYVEDFARGIGHVLAHGAPGETYNVGGPDEAVNLDVVRRI